MSQTYGNSNAGAGRTHAHQNHDDKRLLWCESCQAYQEADTYSTGWLVGVVDGRLVRACSSCVKAAKR